MRIVVLGTGPFAVPMFESLLGSRHEVPALITRPTPPPRGREKGPVNPMRQAAESRAVAVFAPQSVNSEEGMRLIERFAPELLVVCDFGQILSADVLAIPPLGAINLHASLLPKYRGAAPIQWALLNGESETGVSVIHMTPRLDGGPILGMRSTRIGSDETHPQLEERLAVLGIEPVHEAIERLAQWDRSSVIGAPQDTGQATKAPRLKKEQGEVDWSRTAEQIRNQVRALKPWPGTFTFWRRPGHEPLRIVIDNVSVLGLGARAAVRAAELETAGMPGMTAHHAPGEVVVSDGKQLIVATGEGGLGIAAIAPAGKRHMTVEEFLRGYRIRQLLIADRAGAGDFFGGMGTGENGFERVGAAIVKQFDSLIDATQRGRVEALITIARRAEAQVVNLPVGEVRPAMTGGARGFRAFENAPAALGCRG
jgi:methionyl-tRNA formyltransferase